MIELIDELEAGELSVEFEGREPQELLEWALERFSPRIALSTAFQIDGVALLDMAYELEPEIQVFTVDTGRLPEETFELIEQLRDRYSAMNLEVLSPNPRHVTAMVGKHGPNLFYRQVEKRLLCCSMRKVQPLTRHLRRSTPGSPGSGATSGRPGRTSARSRSTTTTGRSSSSTRWRSGPRERSGTTSASERSPTTRSPTAATPRSAAPRAPVRSSPTKRPGTGAGGGRRTPRRSAGSTARSRPAVSSTSCGR